MVDALVIFPPFVHPSIRLSVMLYLENKRRKEWSYNKLLLICRVHFLEFSGMMLIREAESANGQTWY
jgi:hypothetical protein